MSQPFLKSFGYSRILAILAVIASALYLGLVVIPDVPNMHAQDLGDFTQMVPIAYALAIFLLALVVLFRMPRGHLKQHALRGILEGGILAFAGVAALVLSEPRQWGDGTFRWATLYVALLYLGLTLSSLAAVLHLLYAAVIRRLNVRDSAAQGSKAH